MAVVIFFCSKFTICPFLFRILVSRVFIALKKRELGIGGDTNLVPRFRFLTLLLLFSFLFYIDDIAFFELAQEGQG
jgi:hypothetical protein